MWPVTLVVITLNEGRNIERCIKSAPKVSNVMVVDSFSKDNTAKIAESLGAKVYFRKFTSYKDQKEFARLQASQPWVLSLDADEVLSPKLEKEMDALFKKPLEVSGFRIPRLSYHLGRWIKHGGWYPDYQIRLFRRDEAQWEGDNVHELVVLKGECGTLKNNIEHFVFKDLTHQIQTNNKYSSLGARQLFLTHRKFSLLKLVFKPLGKFFECYIWKGGWMDGYAGFIIALGAAQSMFLKHAKLWEMYAFRE